MSTTGNQGRLWAIAEVSKRTPRTIENGAKASEYFGCNTFNHTVMSEKLPKDVYKSLLKTIKSGKKLDQSIAPAVAQADAKPRAGEQKDKEIRAVVAQKGHDIAFADAQKG